MQRVLGVALVTLGVLIGISSPGHAQPYQIEAGRRVGPIELQMLPEEVVERLGEPDSVEAYPSGEPEYFVYEQPQLEIQFSDPAEDEDLLPPMVIMVHTRDSRYAGANGVTIGSLAGEVAAAYGPDYERLEWDDVWMMFYSDLGIKLEFDPASDSVQTIGVFYPGA